MGTAWNDVKHKKETVISGLKTFPDTDERKAAMTKANGAKWPLETKAATSLQGLYEAAAKAKPKPKPEEKEEKVEQVISVALKSYTTPKFAHNAKQKGTLPTWTFQFVDNATKKTGTVDITMTTRMTQDEPTAKKLMSQAAVMEVQKKYPKATVKIDNTSLDKGD